MKARIIYIEHEKAKRINELLMAEKEFLISNKHNETKNIETKHYETIIKKKS